MEENAQFIEELEDDLCDSITGDIFHTPKLLYTGVGAERRVTAFTFEEDTVNDMVAAYAAKKDSDKKPGVLFTHLGVDITDYDTDMRTAKMVTTFLKYNKNAVVLQHKPKSVQPQQEAPAVEERVSPVEKPAKAEPFSSDSDSGAEDASWLEGTMMLIREQEREEQENNNAPVAVANNNNASVPAVEERVSQDAIRARQEELFFDYVASGNTKFLQNLIDETGINPRDVRKNGLNAVNFAKDFAMIQFLSKYDLLPVDDVAQESPAPVSAVAPAKKTPSMDTQLLREKLAQRREQKSLNESGSGVVVPEKQVLSKDEKIELIRENRRQSKQKRQQQELIDNHYAAVAAIRAPAAVPRTNHEAAAGLSEVLSHMDSDVASRLTRRLRFITPNSSDEDSNYLNDSDNLFDYYESLNRALGKKTESPPPPRRFSMEHIRESVPQAFFPAAEEEKVCPLPFAVLCLNGTALAENDECFVKGLVIGQVKKTKFIDAVQGRASLYQSKSTLGVSFCLVKVPEVPKAEVQLWDSSSQERFGRMAQAYTRGAHFAFLFAKSDVEAISVLESAINDIPGAQLYRIKHDTCDFLPTTLGELRGCIRDVLVSEIEKRAWERTECARMLFTKAVLSVTTTIQPVNVANNNNAPQEKSGCFLQ